MSLRTACFGPCGPGPTEKRCRVNLTEAMRQEGEFHYHVTPAIVASGTSLSWPPPAGHAALSVFPPRWRLAGSKLFYVIKHSPMWVSPIIFADVINIITERNSTARWWSPGATTTWSVQVASSPSFETSKCRRIPREAGPSPPITGTGHYSPFWEGRPSAAGLVTPQNIFAIES